MTRYERSIHLMAAHCPRDVNLSAAACKLIDMAPQNEQLSLFVRLLYEFRYTPTDNSGNVYQEFTEDYEKEYADSKAAIDKFFEGHWGLSEEVFHEKLWEYICEESNGDMKCKSLLLAACIENERLPYVNIRDIMTMMQDDFDAEKKRADPLYIAMIRHVESRDFTQIPQDASMFLPIIDKGKDERERAFLLALILISFRNKIISKWPGF